MVKAELHLPSVSRGSISLDGSCTFNFEQPLDFELCYEHDYPEDELCARGETKQLCFVSVADPTMRYHRDWCHILLPSKVNNACIFTFAYSVKQVPQGIYCITIVVSIELDFPACHFSQKTVP